jgi:hypothetical protein
MSHWPTGRHPPSPDTPLPGHKPSGITCPNPAIAPQWRGFPFGASPGIAAKASTFGAVGAFTGGSRKKGFPQGELWDQGGRDSLAHCTWAWEE